MSDGISFDADKLSEGIYFRGREEGKVTTIECNYCDRLDSIFYDLTKDTDSMQDFSWLARAARHISAYHAKA